MPDDSIDPESTRQLGRRMACEGILRAEFGRRASRAADRAMLQLVRVENEKQNLDEISVRSALRFWPLRSKPTVLACAASLALLIGLAIWFFGPTMGEPILTELQGSEISVDRGGTTIPGSLGMRLRPADILRTASNAVAAIGFSPEKSRLVLGPDSELKLSSFRLRKRFELRTGRLEATIAHQRPFCPLTIGTRHAVVQVLGTEFILSVNTNSTKLSVVEGTVRLRKTIDGKRVDVSAGQYFLVTATLEQTVPLPMTGWIYREIWTNLADPKVNLDIIMHPAVASRPDRIEWLDRFDARNGPAISYMAR